MKIRHLLIVTLLLIGNAMFAQDEGYTRGKGFLIRPEVYGGFFLNGGYQFNPYFQVTAGAGVTIDPAVVGQAGARVYTNKGKWAGMIDYHYRRGKYSGQSFTDHVIAGGASYKDLDFGGGFQIVTLGNQTGIGIAITVGWNFRLYKHK